MPTDESGARHASAILRWVEALNRRGEPDAVTAAVDPDIRLERYGFGKRHGQVVEVLDGTDAVAGWLARSPEQAEFSLLGVIAVESPQTAEARYRVVVGDFENVGSWAWRLSPEGRLVWLAHQPDNLPED